jgi:NAD(P)-dependent dehydrogenase (short-subunit alcohol dehydrogenase family)
MHFSIAETLALRALAHLAADGDGLVRFLTLSGLELDDLRARAGDPELLAGVVDFLCSDEKLCTEFLAAENIDSQMLHAARRALPGACEP